MVDAGVFLRAAWVPRARALAAGWWRAAKLLEETTMKIAVTVQGPGGLDAPVDRRFARAAGFLVIDTEAGQSEYLDNWPAASAPRGAGWQAVKQIADCGVRVLLTGRCGPSAFRALQAAGIHVCTVSKGSAKDVIARFLERSFGKTAA